VYPQTRGKSGPVSEFTFGDIRDSENVEESKNIQNDFDIQ
jgi:hypothetical protein